MREENNTSQQPDAANNYQVGGQHYRIREGEQLWDRLVRLYGLANARVFFIGNIIAYLERYQRKDGLLDLQKAHHYLTKLIELEKQEARTKD